MSKISRVTAQSTIGVLIPQDFIPPIKGGQKVCYDFCSTLAERVPVVCFSTHNDHSRHPFRLIQLFSSSPLRYLNFSLILKLGRELKRNKMRCCIVHQPFFVFFAFLACKIARCRLMTYAHNLEFKRSDGLRRYLRPIVFLLEYAAFHLSEIVFFISQTELNEARRRFRLGARQCVLVPHIVRETSPVGISNRPANQALTLVFFGNFSYPPNQRGLDSLLRYIVPLLSRRLTFSCRLIIFGPDLPKSLKSTRVGAYLVIEILGFIENPSSIIRQSDILLSPVAEGAGVQTKIIESIALGTTVLSTKSGARGVDPAIAGGKLQCVEDRDWNAFVQSILDINKTAQYTVPTPDSFFNAYSEEVIIARVLKAINAK